MLFNRHRNELPTTDQALPGRPEQWFSIEPTRSTMTTGVPWRDTSSRVGSSGFTGVIRMPVRIPEMGYPPPARIGRS